jgi:hypothetical protein
MYLNKRICKSVPDSKTSQVDMDGFIGLGLEVVVVVNVCGDGWNVMSLGRVRTHSNKYTA